MTIFGYDGSDFTHTTNFEGLSFVTHKATEHAPDGIYYHRNLASVMNAARNQGIPFLGAYVVPRTGVPAGDQAQTAIDFVRTEVPWLIEHPGFFWQVDLEHWPYDATAPEIGRDLADELERRTGKPAVVYASKGQYGDSYPQDGRVLWNANYNNSGSGDFHQQYQNAGGDNNSAWGAYSGRVPLILQYSSDSTFADGTPGDANAFRGTVDDFRNQILRGVTPPPAPAPTPAPGGSVSELHINDGVTMDSVGTKLKTYYERVISADLLSRLYITSNFRPGDTGYHGDTGSNGALDVAAAMTDQGQRDMRDASEILIRDHDLFLEMIHTTPFNTDNGYYVKNGNVVGETFYGNQVPLHLNHIHIASSESMCDELLRRHPAQAPAPVPEPIPMPTPIPPLPEPAPVPVPLPAPTVNLIPILDALAAMSAKLDALVTKLNSIFK